MTNEFKQTLFKGAVGLAAFAVASSGFDLTGPLATALAGLAGNVASQFGVEACMPFITNKWLNHPDKVVNHHIQRALVDAIHSTLSDIEVEYFNRDDVSAHEAQSLRDFFAVLRTRSETEYMDATREDLPKQEVLDYVYNSASTTQHLQDRLRIKIEATSDDYYFTDRFITYFPNRFTERMQFHFKELLKKGDQAKQAMDLLFFETLNAGLNTIQDTLKLNQGDLRKRFDEILHTDTATLQKVEFYGEIWVSAIRQNRENLDRIEGKIDEVLTVLAHFGLDLSKLTDLLQSIFSRGMQPGLLPSVQFQQLIQAINKTQQQYIQTQENFKKEEAKQKKAEVSLANTPHLDDDVRELLEDTIETAKQKIEQYRRDLLAEDQQQQETKQALTDFLKQVAATQQAIMETTSHRADNARQLFEQGLFAEANAALDADELRRDQADLLQQRDAVSQQLAQLAKDFLLKANLILLAKKQNWFAEARRLYEDAIKSSEGYNTYFALAYFLANHNQHQDATACYEKAIQYAITVADRSSLLNNLGNLYADTGRAKQAEEAFDEALADYRELAEQSRATYLPDVAMTLNNLGILYADTGRAKQAEEAYDEALLYRRELAEQNRATYLPDVAATLNNLGNLYKNTGRAKQAEEAYDEALLYRRELAEQNRATYLPDVAMTLNNLGILYADTGRAKQAEEAYDEALLYRRELAEQNRATYLPDVAMTLNNLGNLYKNTGRAKQAEEAYDEALLYRRELAEQNRATYLPDVAATLNNLGNLYKNTGRAKQAEEAYDEALLYRRELAEQNRATYLPDVAMTLNNLGILYKNTGRAKQAEEAYDEALADYRELAEQNRATYLPNVAATLNNLGNLYKNTGRAKQAEEAYDEALADYRELAEQNRATYLPNVAATLNNLGNLYKNTGRAKQAEEAYDEALADYRELAEQNRATYLPDVAMTLNNLGVLYADTGRTKQAEEAYDEAIDIRLALARQAPDSYAVSVAETAVNLSIFYLNQQPDSNRESSIDYALVAISWSLPYLERIDYALKIFQMTVQICEHWGINWREELQKRQDEAKEGNEDVP